MNFPSNLTPETFDRELLHDFARWRSAVLECACTHGIPQGEVEPFSEGSNLVAAVGNRVVKIFPPFHRHQWQSERYGLLRFANQLPISIPELVAEGERPDGWTYLIMSRVGGEPLSQRWPAYDDTLKVSMLEQIGRLMARAHAVAPGDPRGLAPAWGDFLKTQVAGAHARHSRLGMPGWFLDELDAFLYESRNETPSRFEPVLLTGEYTPFNLLIGSDGGRETLVGMIDFGDAMIGPREYDFLGPCLFLAEGKPTALRALFTGYGIRSSEQSAGLARRLMRLQILHRYSHFERQLKIPDWKGRAASIVELQELIFPVS